MIRNLYQKDLPHVLLIEKSVHIAPWTEDTFKICFQSGFTGWVCEVDEKIVGFIIVSITQHECHILNLCINAPNQKQGYGSLLIKHLIAELKKRNVQMVYLEVRRSNSRAISLYKKFKFHLIGERKNYYPTVSGQEDALIYVKLLIDKVKD